MIWQARNQAERQLTIVRPGVVFGKGENGNFTRLYWGIRGGKFIYPGRKDTVKACIYVKELVRFMLYRLEHHEQGVELYNCTFEPAYTIEQIVETMKKVTDLKKGGTIDTRMGADAGCHSNWLFGRTHGNLSCPCEKTDDIYEYLWEKAFSFRIQIPLFF